MDNTACLSRSLIALLVAAALAAAREIPPKGRAELPEAGVGVIVGDALFNPRRPINGTDSDGFGRSRVMINNVTGNHLIYVGLNGLIEGITMVHLRMGTKTPLNGPKSPAAGAQVLGVVPALSTPPTQLFPTLTSKGNTEWTLPFTGSHLQTWLTNSTSPADATAQFLDLLQTDQLFIVLYTAGSPPAEIQGVFRCRKWCRVLTEPLD